LGRGFLAIADRGKDVLPAQQLQATRVTFDVLGNKLSITDARGNQTLRQTFDGVRRAILADSADAGTKRTLFDVSGRPVRSWDSRKIALRHSYDALHRPLGTWVQQAQLAEQRLIRIIYGEGSPDDEVSGRRTRLYRVYDGAGLLTHDLYNLDGKLTACTRRLAQDFRDAPDWPEDPIAADALLESESWASAQQFDAIGRLTTRTAPDGRMVVMGYDLGGLLTSLSVAEPGAAASAYVSAIDHDARGQRTRVAFGSGMTTTREYDAETFRLVHQRTISAKQALQDLTYAHDPIGNITSISDAVSYANSLVAADGLYEYDAIYQLMEAEGRELPNVQPSELAPPIHPNDYQALQRYHESYDYDPAGNILSMTHNVLTPNGARWKRSYAYEAVSNRLAATSAPGDPAGTLSASYTYDAAGNLATMPHLPQMDWDQLNRLVHIRRQNGIDPNDIYFAYGVDGQRVRRVYEHSGIIERRVYFDGWELYRSVSVASGQLTEERSTLHVEDGHTCVALVDVETVDAAVAGLTSTTTDRYQLADHLGSFVMETDPSGTVIAYEDFHPYGTCAFSARANSLDGLPRQYGYNGKERDDETSLYYFGARYYAAWLGRWTAPDPAGFVDGINLYVYVRNCPTCRVDRDGAASEHEDITARKALKPNTIKADVYEQMTVVDRNGLRRVIDTAVVKPTRLLDPPKKRSLISLEAKQPEGPLTKNQIADQRAMKAEGSKAVESRAKATRGETFVQEELKVWRTNASEGVRDFVDTEVAVGRAVALHEDLSLARSASVAASTAGYHAGEMSSYTPGGRGKGTAWQDLAGAEAPVARAAAPVAGSLAGARALGTATPLETAPEPQSLMGRGPIGGLGVMVTIIGVAETIADVAKSQSWEEASVKIDNAIAIAGVMGVVAAAAPEVAAALALIQLAQWL
jgi:RHS repeat-associated protein